MKTDNDMKKQKIINYLMVVVNKGLQFNHLSRICKRKTYSNGGEEQLSDPNQKTLCENACLRTMGGKNIRACQINTHFFCYF